MSTSTSSPLASSGEIVTPHYGEAWDVGQFERRILYGVKIQQPWNKTERYENVSLVLRVEQDLLTELGGAGEKDNYDFSVAGGGLMDRNIRNITMIRPTLHHSPFTVVYPGHYIQLSRKVSVEKLSEIRREKIPGMRVTWSYNETIIPERNFLSKNRYFIQLANMVHKSQDSQHLWSLARQSRDKLWRVKREKDCNKNMLINQELLGGTIEDIGVALNLTQTSSEVSNVTEETVGTAGELYVYLIYCPTGKMREWQEFYADLLRRPVKTILLTLSSIMSKKRIISTFEFNLASMIFNKISSAFDLKSRNMDQFLKMTAEHLNASDIIKLIGKRISSSITTCILHLYYLLLFIMLQTMPAPRGS